jgi:hypothetical protein
MRRSVKPCVYDINLPINRLLLSVKDRPCTLAKEECPIMISIDFEGGGNLSGKRVASDASTPNYYIKWENGDTNRMHIVGADVRESWPIRSAIHGIPALAAGNHLRHTAVNHLTVRKISIYDVQWSANLSLRTLASLSKLSMKHDFKTNFHTRNT